MTSTTGPTSKANTTASTDDAALAAAVAPDAEASDVAVDGRSSRWDKHRAKRRTELVEATLRAIRSRGASVGMDDIAAFAGTSKTVYYRHFTDRAGLYGAVAERVNAIILRDITRAVGDLSVFTGSLDDSTSSTSAASAASSPRDLLGAAVDSYLALVEHDPEVYRFIVAAPLVPPSERTETIDLASTVNQAMALQIGNLIAAALATGGRNTEPAATWGHAVVGMVRAAGDEWLRTGAADSGTSRETLKEHLTELIWGGLSSAWPTTGATPDKE